MLPRASKGRSSSSSSRANPMMIQYLRRIIKPSFWPWQLWLIVQHMAIVLYTLFVVLAVSLFHFLLTGVFLATFCWFLTNAYLREEAPNSYVVEQRVEWMYAFDVHCNSFFPMFVLLYVIHYFLSPPLVAHGFVPVLLSNLLFMMEASYYHYLNFLGYDVLPFLERTTFFMYQLVSALSFLLF